MIVLAAHLAAAVALLLWSVRLIRTGVERAFLPELRRKLKGLSHRPLTAAAGGGLSAMLLQSSTAVALIGAGFAVSGMLAPPAALALLLGADLGSALMTQVFVLPIQSAIPFVLLAGVAVFFNSRSRKAKQAGRIAIGFALVLMSLGMIRAAAAPIGENEIVADICAYFESDLLSAYAIGVLLAWVMHSSLAAVLTIAAFAAAGMTAAPVAAALLIGANMGGALIPFILLWSAPRAARLITLANLTARGFVSILAMALLLTGYLEPAFFGPLAAQQVVLLHITLNVVLVVVALPLVTALIGLAGALTPEDADPEGMRPSALDQDVLGDPQLALPCAQRELLRMAETVQRMLTAVMHLFRAWDGEVASLIERLEEDVDRMHFETKIYIAQLRAPQLPPEQSRRAVELVAMANGLEEAADRIAVNLVTQARKMHERAILFSPEGMADIESFHDQVVTNTQLALSVLTTGDAEAARQLVAEKDRIRGEEQKLQERHLARLGKGALASVESTNIHQETLRLLKQINAAISYIAYPIAEETGDLLDSRLARPRRAGGHA